MKRKSILLLSVLTVALLLTAFIAGQASASTGCFNDTNGHWAETFICWMKDNGITTGIGGGNYGPEDNVTRAQMAVFMQKLDELAVSQANSADAANLAAAKTYADAQDVTNLSAAKAYADAQDVTNLTAAKAYADAQDVTNLAAANTYADAQDATNLTAANAYTDTSLSTGNILISAGFGNWNPFNSTDPLSYTYFSSQTQISRSAIGSSFLSINPDVPTVLYGRSLSFKGVEFCFDTFASTTLNYVEINTYSHTTGSLGRNLRFSDPTTRTGNHCQLYMLSTPVVLTANDGVNFFIQVNWAVASTQFAIGRTTFIFEPTSTIAAPPVAPQSLGPDVEIPSSPTIDTSAP